MTAASSTIHGSIPDRDKRLFCPSERPDRLRIHPASYWKTEADTPESGRFVNVTIALHLVLRLRKIAFRPALLPYVFMAWTGWLLNFLALIWTEISKWPLPFNCPTVSCCVYFCCINRVNFQQEVTQRQYIGSKALVHVGMNETDGPMNSSHITVVIRQIVDIY